MFILQSFPAMLVEQEIAEIMTEVAKDPLDKAEKNIALAVQS